MAAGVLPSRSNRAFSPWKRVSLPATGARSSRRWASSKSDARDALAIAEACLRPNLHFVPIKGVAQQDLQLRA